MGAPSLALAQGPQPPPAAPQETPAEIKQQGDQAMESLRYADALALYSQAYTMTKDPALLYNEGRAEQALGNYPGALADFLRFQMAASPELRARVPKLDELIADVRKHVARILIRTPTAGAQVLVRDHVVGVTPLAGPLDVDSGHITLDVEAEGFETFHRELDLEGGTDTVIDAQLTPRKQTAMLRVTATAASAFVSIDGSPVGNAPVEQVLTPGTHKVSVHRDGYEDTESTVVLSMGERKELQLDPQKNAPVYAKWWFWTGVGAVVVGGVVTAVALTTEKSPSKGDAFTPNQVSAPITRF